MVGIFSKDASDDTDMPVEKVVTVEDYNGEEDAKSIMIALSVRTVSPVTPQQLDAMVRTSGFSFSIRDIMNSIILSP